MPERQALKWLGWILFAAAVVRIALMVGVVSGDYMHYVTTAKQFLDGQYQPVATAWSVRLGLSLPVALSFAVFGFNDRAATLFPLLCSLANIAIAYWLVAKLASPRAGLMAATLLALVPVDIYQAGDLHCDLPISTWIALAFALCIGAQQCEDAPRRSRLALAGLCFFLAHLTKISALVFLPVIAVPSLLRRRFLEAALPILVCVAGIAVEAGVYGVVTGDVGFRLRAELSAGTHLDQVVLAGYGDPALNRFLAVYEVPRMLLKPFLIAEGPWFSLHFLVLLAAAALAPMGAWVKARPLVVWLVLAYLPLSFGVRDFDSFAPWQIRFPRVMEPLLIPAMGLCAVLMADWGRRRLMGLFGILLPVSLYCAYGLLWGERRPSEQLRQIASYAAAEETSESVYVDMDVFIVLRYLEGFKEPTRLRVWPEAPPRTGTVVVNWQGLSDREAWWGRPAPAWIRPLQSQPTIHRFNGVLLKPGPLRPRLAGTTITAFETMQSPTVYLVYRMGDTPVRR